MRKGILTITFILICTIFTFAQEVEKLGEIKEVKYYTKEPAQSSPYGISIDEVKNEIQIRNGSWNGCWYYNINDRNFSYYDGKKTVMNGMYGITLGKYFITGDGYGIYIQKNNIESVNLAGKIKNGISFILKKSGGYIVYYVDKEGKPGAVDTEGRTYTSDEATGYLEEYDAKKYARSKERARELGLEEPFSKSEVLVWGENYFSNPEKMRALWNKKGYIATDLIQYDMQGYGYQMLFYKDTTSQLCIMDNSGNRIVSMETLNNYSKIMEQEGEQLDFSTSWFVGYGGNIYYYIAGDEYTEVFRIRRTWGSPDMYALAVNGYTEDSYGDYVEKTLPEMSNADLRLLRNTVYALYGVHFKSGDLSSHFNREVWYTDEGKTSSEVKLPQSRQKIVEMIQGLEAEL